MCRSYPWTIVMMKLNSYWESICNAFIDLHQMVQSQICFHDWFLWKDEVCMCQCVCVACVLLMNSASVVPAQVQAYFGLSKEISYIQSVSKMWKIEKLKWCSDAWWKICDKLLVVNMYREIASSNYTILWNHCDQISTVIIFFFFFLFLLFQYAICTFFWCHRVRILADVAVDSCCNLCKNGFLMKF